MAQKEIQGPQKLGPLTPLVGEWEGNGGVDLSYHNEDDEISETSGFERASFKPIPVQENGDQMLQGLNYKITNWRHGEEAMDPFHDEVGYLLWEKTTGQVMQCVVFGRGISILAGADAGPRDKKIHFKAEPGDPTYGILQNKHLLENAELKTYEHTFTFNDDGTISHNSDIVLKHAAAGKSYHHTDESILHCVKRFHPSIDFD
jgi:hypothetical protein